MNDGHDPLRPRSALAAGVDRDLSFYLSELLDLEEEEVPTRIKHNDALYHLRNRMVRDREMIDRLEDKINSLRDELNRERSNNDKCCCCCCCSRGGCR